MALSRCGMVLTAGILLSGSAVALAQSSTTSSQSYDQMKAAQQKQAQSTETPATTPAPAATAQPAPQAPAPAEAAPAVAPAAAADGAVPADGAQAATAKPAPKPPLLDKHGKPIKVKVKKEKPPKLVPVQIVHGELTVDGLIAKAGLNFQITDLKFLYISVPGLGTAVISNNPFPGAKIQANALDGSTLTVKAQDHQLQVTSETPMLEPQEGKKLLPGKKKPALPTSLYVLVDQNYQQNTTYPEFGYGDVNKAPYNWPGTLTDLRTNNGAVKAPPLPENLRQKQQIIKLCAKNADGTQGPCHETDVPLVTGKKS